MESSKKVGQRRYDQRPKAEECPPLSGGEISSVSLRCACPEQGTCAGEPGRLGVCAVTQEPLSEVQVEFPSQQSLHIKYHACILLRMELFKGVSIVLLLHRHHGEGRPA